MKKTLFILCALLLTAVGASAQDVTTAYTFKAKDWVSIDANRVSDSNISYDEASNTITVNAGTGANNVALANGSSVDGTFSTSNYTVTNEQHWFIVVGTSLSDSTAADDYGNYDSYLWWMDGANDGENWVPTLVQTLSDGQVLFAWDLSLMLEIDGNLQNETNYLDGWTGFGLTSTTGTSVISDICFYTTEDAITKYSELEGVLQDATPYKFVCTDWVSLDTGRVTNENITPNETSNTISVVAGTGANNVALGNSTSTSVDGPFTTANYYVTNDQCWFVVVGTNLATGKTETNNACDSYLWWMDGANWGSWVPTEVAQSADGSVMIAWDLSTMTEIDVNLKHERNTLDGWTGFGLTSTTGTSVISDINFYTYEEMIETYPELNQRTPYTFEAEEWVASDNDRATASNITHNADGTITVVATGANNIALGNSPSQTFTTDNHDVTTANKYITSDQKYFVIIGSDLATGNTDSYWWWMNGINDWTNNSSQVVPDEYVTLTDGQILLAWDISSYLSQMTADADGNITLNGCTCFGLTSTAANNASTISYIGFYTDTQLDAATNGVEWEMTDAGWGTLILPFAATIPTDEEGAAALTLYAGDALELSSDGTTITVGTASETIAANTPYLVSGTEGKYTFTGTYEEATGTLASGMLTGTFVDMTYSDFTANSGQYVLQMHSGDTEPAFYPITSESTNVTLDAYHCYLTLDSGTSPDGVRAFIGLPDSGDETAIEAVKSEEEAEANGAIYDLSGRRVSKAVKGVYIQNGKKVLVK